MGHTTTNRLSAAAPGSGATDATPALQGVRGVTRVIEADHVKGVVGYEVESERGRDVRGDLARAIVQSGWGLLELRPMRMSLEEIFLSLTTDEEPTPATEEPVHA